MNETAPFINDIKTQLQSGEITLESDDVYMVKTDYSMTASRQAASCIIKPQTGDKVLLYNNEGNAYILAVLERKAADGSETNIVFKGQVNLYVEDGGLSLSTNQTLHLASANDINCATSGFSVNAFKGEIKIERLTFVSRLVHFQAKTIKTVAAYIESTCRRLTERLENSFRFVKQHEETQSRTSRHLAKETFTVHAKNAIHMAEENVTINAEQIHLG